MAAPQPIAHGSLEQTPFAHVLTSIAQRGLVGTLAVWAPPGEQGQDRIFFREGTIEKARLLTPSSDLARGLLPLFRRETTYAFYEEDLVGEDQLEGSVDARALLVAGLRGGIREGAADAILGRFGGQPLRVTRSADVAAYQLLPKERAFLDMFRAVPTTVEAAIADAGNEKVARRVLYALAITKALEVFEGEFDRRSLTELSRGAAEMQGARAKAEPAAPVPSSAPPQPAAPTSQAAPTAPPAPAQPRAAAPTTPKQAPPKPPSGRRRRSAEEETTTEPPAELSNDLKARWRKLVQRAEALDEQNYFEMLGVDKAAGNDAVRDAYFAQVKTWHPDRLPPELAPLREQAETIFQHLTAAHETLTDAEERGKYLKQVQDGGGTPKADREMQRILGAAMEFQKVEVLIRRREWARAEKLVRELMDRVPEEADYHAALGLIRWQSLGDEGVGEALEHLDHALDRTPNHERALMTKARLLDRRGDKKEAIRLFERVLELNPKNVDAERHVRLAKMRGQGTGSREAAEAKDEKKDSGLFGKLFGGKKK